MNNLDNIVYYAKLYNLYGNLLTDKQQEYFTSYFDLDLSLTEIANENGISKTAVSDNINKTIKKLEEFEKHLKLLEKQEKISELISQAENKSAEELKKIIKEIGEINGI